MDTEVNIETTLFPSVHTPMDTIFAEYRQQRANIERIAAFVHGDGMRGMNYFVDGMRVKHKNDYVNPSYLFEVEPAIGALDAAFWTKVMSYTDVIETMDAGSKNEWNRSISEHKTPPFERDTVETTIADLLLHRKDFFAKRVDGIWRRLSGEHITNAPQGFGKRMIVARMIDSYDLLSIESSNYIHDLRFVISKFMDNDVCNGATTYTCIDALVRGKQYGKWFSFDGGALRLRVYKCGTCHIEVHPEVAYRLNQVLSWLYPMAIPPEFRTKPKKAFKEFSLRHDLLSGSTLQALSARNISKRGDVYFLHGEEKSFTQELVSVLVYLGGVKHNSHGYVFDYNPSKVFSEIQRTGFIPEYQSYQYYPTPEIIARMVVDMASIQDDDEMLEPSAGQGGLADFLPAERTTCVEISQIHCKVLEGKGYSAICADFLAWKTDTLFSKIIMNPPFADSRASDHVLRASELLKKDGRLVAVMPASFRGKMVVPGFKHTWSEQNYSGFKNTGVSVVILAIEKQL